ncbi:MAG: hypothetical protein U0Q15_20870 [Kineosporiaceae bacterium]
MALLRRPLTGRGCPRPRRHRRPAIVASAVVGAWVAVAALVASTNGAFRATTSSGSTSFGSSTVVLADSQGGTSAGATGTALFSATGAKPGSTDTRCIRVTYSGSATSATVHLFVSAGGSTGLAPYLRLSIDEGTTGSSSTCSDFGGTVTNLWNSGDTDDTKTLSASTAASGTWATGVSSWVPTASGQTRTYRITWTVLGANAAQNTTTSTTFRWEARA